MTTPPVRITYLLLIKTILFGAVLSLLAVLPLLGNRFSKRLDYKEKNQSVELKPGENWIGDLIITLDQRGRVLKVKKIKHRITGRFLGFRNLRTFLFAGMPFVPLLAFCIFFLWSEEQPKTPFWS